MTFETVRPTNDPLVVAISDPDPDKAFLELMRERLGPGEWAFPIDDGFAWIPYRLRHSIECWRNEDGDVIARSTFVLVEGADEGPALGIAAYLNQRSFGGAVWFDAADSTVRLTTIARLDPANWWNAYIFAATVVRLVGVCEHLAPRLASWVDGRVAVAAHPVHGERADPDQFYDEHAVDTYVPEAGAGLWWSAHEVGAFREVFGDSADSSGGSAEWRGAADDETLLFDSMGGFARLPVDDGWLAIMAGEADHPDLGLGFQVLLTPSVVFAGEEQSAKWDGLLVANEVNRQLAIVCPAPLTIAGWTVWRDQLQLATFVWPEIMRMLQSAAGPTMGEALGILVTSLSWNANPVSHVLGQLDDLELLQADEVNWRGVSENAGFKSLLVNETEVVPAALAGVPVNELLSDPIELDDQMWALQHSEVLLSVGIFNPAGPSIGTLELTIDYNLQRGMLIERLRHPFAPAIRLRGLIDREGFESLDDFVELLIPRLDWSTFEWARVLARRPEIADAVERGLLRFARRESHDSGRHAQQLADGLHDPWVRVAHDYQPSGSLDDLGGDPAEIWLGLVTHPVLVDTSLAYLRSAWEGSKSFLAHPDDPSIAAQWVTRVGEEVDRRRAGLA